MNHIRAAIPDLLMLSGGVSASYGAWLAWPPAGYLVCGVLAIAAGLMIARAG